MSCRLTQSLGVPVQRTLTVNQQLVPSHILPRREGTSCQASSFPAASAHSTGGHAPSVLASAKYFQFNTVFPCDSQNQCSYPLKRLMVANLTYQVIHVTDHPSQILDTESYTYSCLPSFSCQHQETAHSTEIEMLVEKGRMEIK